MNKFIVDENDKSINIIFILFIIAILVYAMVMAILYINNFLQRDGENQIKSPEINQFEAESYENIKIAKDGYKYSVENGEAKLLDLSDLDSEIIKNNILYIPGEITDDKKSYKVTGIGEGAFKGKLKAYDIKQVHIPETVTHIGTEAFMGNKLESLNIPSSVKTIGKSAFRENQIQYLELGNSLEIIEENAFADNSLKEIKLPDSVKQVKSGSFLGNKIMEVQIGGSVQLSDWAINDRFADAYFFSLGEKGIYIRQDEYLYTWKIIK